MPGPEEPRWPDRLAALAVVAFFEDGEILEVALHARDEVFVLLPAHHPQLPLAAGSAPADASLDSQARRQPRPFRAGEDDDGADE
jgi:hypothetical protein